VWTFPLQDNVAWHDGVPFTSEDVNFTLRGPPERVEAWLREQVTARSEEVRSLKAIRAVERTAEGVKVSLHNSAEPALKVLEPNVKVACHLYG